MYEILLRLSKTFLQLSLATFANDMRYARRAGCGAAGAAFLSNESSCVSKLECMSHHKTESHFAQNVSAAKKPKSLQPIIIPIVVQ